MTVRSWKRSGRRVRSRLAACLAWMPLLAGCVTSDHMYLVRRDVKCSFDEPMPFLPKTPDRPFVEIAAIEATGRVFLPTEWETLRLMLCLQARNVGADAVVELVQEHIGYSIQVIAFKIDWANKKLSATAIRYLDPGESPEEIEAPAVDQDGKPIEELGDEAAGSAVGDEPRGIQPTDPEAGSASDGTPGSPQACLRNQSTVRLIASASE